MQTSLPAPQTDPKRPNRVDQLTPKVRNAIQLMVWDGKSFTEAAKEVGLTSRAMRLALEKPKVVAALKREMQVLRDSEQPRSLRRLVEIRDADNNMPAIHAIRTLLRIDDEQNAGRATNISIGAFVIVQPNGALLANSPEPVTINNDTTD